MSRRRRGPQGNEAKATGTFANRRRFLLTVWVLSGAVLLTRAAEVQVAACQRR